MLNPGEVHVWMANDRGALHGILARYLDGAEPQIEIGAHSKPRLAGAQAWLHFNLSHTRGLALIAVARDVEVGVDVERVRRVPEMTAIARRWLGIECVANEDEFFRAWTRHEAMVKALGTGLSESPADFHGFVAEVNAGEGYRAALAALLSEPPMVVCLRLPENEAVAGIQNLLDGIE